MANSGSFYITNSGNDWNTYTSATSYTVHTATVPNPLPPKPKTEVDLLLADVEQVCRVARAA